jgi:uncharacterized protein YbjQ (UPF0145 family)
MTTTPSIEGKPITEYKGIVTAEAIMGANVFKDMAAQIRNFVGGRSGAYEGELVKARDAALKELKLRTWALKANAVVGLRLDYELFADKHGSMLMVVASGTAVVIEGEETEPDEAGEAGERKDPTAVKPTRKRYR